MIIDKERRTDEATPSSATTSSATTTLITTNVSFCPEPDWFNDTQCDDENNIPECNYDGGDCCQENPPDDWDDLCIECECKPSTNQTINTSTSMNG